MNKMPTFNKTDASYILCVCLLPLTLLLFNDAWIYDLLGESDSAMYLGYFLNYGQHLWEYEHCYKVSRIPWILAGYGIFQLFTPLTAHFVLAFANLWSFLIVFYLVLRLHTAARYALVATLCLASYTYLHHSGGWYYHNIIAHTFYLLSLYFTFRIDLEHGDTEARSLFFRKSVMYLLLSGFFLATAIHTNNLLVNFIPIIVVITWRRRDGSSPFLKNLLYLGGWLLVGGMVATLFWGILSWWSGSSFWFFVLQVKHVLCFLLGIDTIPQSVTFAQLLANGYHLVLPFFVAVVSGIILFGNRGKKTIFLKKYPHLPILIWVLITHLAWEFKGSATLHLRHSFNIVPPTFLALGQLLSYFFSKKTISIPSLWAVVGYIILLILPLVTVGIFVQYYLDQVGLRPVALILFVTLSSMAFWKIGSLRRLTVICLFFGISNMLMSSFVFNYAVFLKNCLHKKAEFLAKIEGFRAVSEFDPDLKARFWLSPQEMVVYNEKGCSPYNSVPIPTAGFMGMIVDKRLGYNNLFEYPGPATFEEIPESNFLQNVPVISCGCLYPEVKEVPPNFPIEKFVVMSVFENVIDEATERFDTFEKVNFRLDQKVKISQPPIEYWIGMYVRTLESP